MWQKLGWKIASIVDRLTGRGHKKAKYRMPLDEPLSRFYPTTKEEDKQLAGFIVLLGNGFDQERLVTPPPGWRVVGWRQGSIHLRREIRGTTNMAGYPRPYIVPLTSGGEREEFALPSDYNTMRAVNPHGTSHGGSPRSNNTSEQQLDYFSEFVLPPPHPSTLHYSPTPPPLTTPTHRPLRWVPNHRTLVITNPSSRTPSPPPYAQTPTTTMQQQRTSLPRTPQLSTTPLTPTILKVLLDTFDAALAHTHYAITGHAALMVWGYRGTAAAPAPAHVSVVCLAQHRQVILTWARAAGWWVSSSSSSLPSSCSQASIAEYAHQDGDEEDAGKCEVAVIGVPAHGQVWPFQLRAIGSADDDGLDSNNDDDETVSSAAWDRLGAVRPLALPPPYVGSVGDMVRTGARVMAVPALLDEFARAWYFCAGKKRPGEGTQRGRYIASLVLWILRRLAWDAERLGDGGRWRLTTSNVPCVIFEGFWCPFIRRYPESRGLFEICGLHFPEPSSAWDGPWTETPSAETKTGTAFSPDSYKMREARGECPTRPRVPSLEEAYRGLEIELLNLV